MRHLGFAADLYGDKGKGLAPLGTCLAQTHALQAFPCPAPDLWAFLPKANRLRRKPPQRL
ncbi:MAG: hypothetical protein ACO2PK_10255 [Armatimonadota bacterium]